MILHQENRPFYRLLAARLIVDGLASEGKIPADTSRKIQDHILAGMEALRGKIGEQVSALRRIKATISEFV